MGHLVDRNELLATILTSFEEEYTLFEQRKFEDIISFSRSISNTIGKFVRVSVFGKERVGYVQDISDTGSLLLQVEGIVEEILAGDVDFPAPPLGGTMDLLFLLNGSYEDMPGLRRSSFCRHAAHGRR